MLQFPLDEGTSLWCTLGVCTRGRVAMGMDLRLSAVDPKPSWPTFCVDDTCLALAELIVVAKVM